MGKFFRIGDLVVVNDIDQPCGRLVAVVVGIAGDQLKCSYLNAASEFDWWEKNPLTTGIEYATHLKDFGCVLMTDSEKYVVKKIGESRATYADGSHRPWQERCEVAFKARKALLDLSYHNAFFFVF